MNSLCKVILALGLVCTFLPQGNCLNCYKCDTLKGTDCDQPFNPDSPLVEIEECGVGQDKYKDYQCIEYDIRIGSDRNAKRGCTPLIPNYSHCTFLLQQEVSSHGIIKVFSCDQCLTEKCNSHDFKPAP